MVFIPRFPDATWDPISPYTKTGAFKVDKQDDTKFVIHRTQGDSYPRSTYKRGGGIPHWTILHDGKCYQHYEINQFSRALLNLRGGVQTNLDSALQVELVGFTGDDMNPAQLATLGKLILWCFANTSLKNVWLGGDPSQPNKLTNSQWDTGSGMTPHWFVPENNHHDTINHHDWIVLKAILRGQRPPPATPPKETDTMTIFTKPAGYVIRRTAPLSYDEYAKGLQRELNRQMGQLGGPLAIDGMFGAATERRVVEAQTALGVTADGLWGDASHMALIAFVDARTADVIAFPDPGPIPPRDSLPSSAHPAGSNLTGPNFAAVKNLLEDLEEASANQLELIQDLIAELSQ
jgi:peptidoglycan hydrolase-like protein with peptidoglycan-binding domain